MSDVSKRKKRRGGKKFTDVLQDAYLRYLSLGIYREVEAIRRGELTAEASQALLDRLTTFDERFPYQEIWRREWERKVMDGIWTADPSDLLGAIEEMVKAAVTKEEAERKARGDLSVFYEDDYLHFADRSIQELFQQDEDELFEYEVKPGGEG